MPVLGSSVAASSGQIKPGVYLPTGWNKTWQAARNAAASQLVEVVVFGDSTTSGSCTTAGVPVFSWVNWLRTLSIAAGYTDGGRGISAYDYTAIDPGLPATDQILPVTGTTVGFNASAPPGPVTPSATASNTAGDTITFQGRGTALRLHYTSNYYTGRFSYSVDGGAPVTVDAYRGSYGYDTIYVGGLTEGTHTINVTNLVGTAQRPPTTSFLNPTGSANGTLPAGTYYYVVTGTTAAGETTVSPVITSTVGANAQVYLQMNTLQSGQTGIKVYRGTSASGPFGLVGSSATNTFTDTGGAAPAMGTNPPGTSTAGYDTSVNMVSFNVDFFRASGIVYHRNATSGISSGTYFGTNVTTPSPNAQAALGLTPGVGVGSALYDWGTAKLAGPRYRTPALAICALGINDMQGLSLAQEGTPTTTESDTATRQVAYYENFLAHFVRMARQAGADPLIVVPHFDMAQHAHTWGGQFIRTAWSAGVANGCAVIDFNQAIRPVATMPARGLGNPGVHAEVNTYKAEAQFLWDNALSL